MTRLPRPVAYLAPLAVVTWALAPLPFARAQEAAQQYVLMAAPQYCMLPGPEGVTWCAGQVVAEGRPLVELPAWQDREALRLASLVKAGSDTPVFQVLLPTIRDTGNFTLALGTGGRLYYADPSVRLWAYLTPAEFDAILADPTGCARVYFGNVRYPDQLYHQLTEEPWTWIVRERAPQLLEELERLHAPLHGPPNPNEPWTNPKPDPEAFTQRLVELLNRIIGNDSPAVSLYQRDRYAKRLLPIQIIEVMRQIDELGGAYDGTPTAPGNVAGTARNDPWVRYRDKEKLDEPTPSPSGPRSPAEISQHIRLLNRLLLEYDLGGSLQGTMYRWTKDLPDYVLPSSCTATGYFTEGARVLLRSISDLYDVMPMRFEANGAVSLLLEPRSARETGVEFAFYEVGPGGELAGPQPEAPPDHTTWGTNTHTTYGVYGRDVRWVTVEYGLPPTM